MVIGHPSKLKGASAEQPAGAPRLSRVDCRDHAPGGATGEAAAVAPLGFAVVFRLTCVAASVSTAVTAAAVTANRCCALPRAGRPKCRPVTGAEAPLAAAEGAAPLPPLPPTQVRVNLSRPA